jgi:hypothetical protein
VFQILAALLLAVVNFATLRGVQNVKRRLRARRTSESAVGVPEARDWDG